MNEWRFRLCVAVALLTLLWPLAAGAGPLQDADKWRTFIEQCLSARKREALLQSVSLESRLGMESFQDEVHNNSDANALGRDVLRLHRAQVLLALGAKEEAMNLLFGVVGRPDATIEAVFSLYNPVDRRASSRSLRDALGCLAPLSAIAPEAFHRDFARDSHRIVVPRCSREVLTRIADRLYGMGLYEEATEAYRESIYYGGVSKGTRDRLLSPHVCINTNECVWCEQRSARARPFGLSDEGAKLWLKIAECELFIGAESQAAGSMAKAIIYGGTQDVDAATIMIRQYTRDSAGKMHEARPTTNDVADVARMYAQMACHPRALLWIRKVAPVLDAAWGKRLEDKYLREWGEVLDELIYGRLVVSAFVREGYTNGVEPALVKPLLQRLGYQNTDIDESVVLFGTKCATKAEAMAVRIPYCLEEERLRRFSESVRQIMGQKSPAQAAKGQTF